MGSVNGVFEEVLNAKVNVASKIIGFRDFESIIGLYKEPPRVVQCHGVFDLLHIGHIKHFQSAKRHGDILVVTLTPDHHVNKGPNRPCFMAQLRAEAIAALDCVDYVIINQWPTAIEAIRLIKPHVYVKGAEYENAKNDLTGKIAEEVEVLQSIGGKIEFTYDPVFSSSALLNQFFSPLSPKVVQYLSGFKQRYRSDDILNYFEAAQKLKVLVVGEAIIDIYHFSEVIGKAGKEPILVAKHKQTETYAGGTLALSNHLSDFCDQVTCLTYLGEKGEYQDFIAQKLKPNVSLAPIYKKNAPTIVKRRYVEEYSSQKLFESYEITDDFLEGNNQADFLKQLDAWMKSHDLVIVADYGHGLLNETAVEYLTQKAKFLAVNTQSNASNHGFNCISKYPRANYVAIANRELQLNYRQKHLSTKEQFQRLLRDHDYQQAMITMGKIGAYTCKQGEDISEVPAFATNVIDRVGAGDAVLAITSLFAYQNAPSEITAFVGNVVGAEAVNIMGHKRFIEKVPLMKHIAHLLK